MVFARYLTETFPPPRDSCRHPESSCCLGSLAGAPSRETPVPNGEGFQLRAEHSFIENVSDDLRIALHAEDQLSQVV